MDVLEFLNRTNQRNLKCTIGLMVKKRLTEYANDLERRRANLHFMLQYENLQNDEELAVLFQERIAEAERKRFEWIGLERLRRERAEEELLKLKNEQRQIENCEEMRALQSRQILNETKAAQLQQIEERKILKMREKHIDEMWLVATQRLYAAKEQQAIYEQKLRKHIAALTQAQNMAQNKAKLEQLQQEAVTLQRQYAIEHEYAAQHDAKAEKLQQFKNFCQQQQQQKELQTQIQSNRMIRAQLATASKAEEQRAQEQLNARLMQDLWQRKGEWLNNRNWHQQYLAHAQQQRNEERQKLNEFEQIYLGTGCVLQQSNKKPYDKNVR